MHKAEHTIPIHALNEYICSEHRIILLPIIVTFFVSTVFIVTEMMRSLLHCAYKKVQINYL